jgi:hypothetical protein
LRFFFFSAGGSGGGCTGDFDGMTVFKTLEEEDSADFAFLFAETRRFSGIFSGSFAFLDGGPVEDDGDVWLCVFFFWELTRFRLFFAVEVPLLLLVPPLNR